jgi:hypothetical protein
MAIWMGKFLDREWKPNKKGTGNAKHKCDVAVQQREEYTHACKAREYQTLVWHHVPLIALKTKAAHRHIFEMAEMGVWVDRLSIIGDKERELMHNVWVFEEGGVQMAEVHVDFLHADERKRLYPRWGGRGLETGGQNEAAL